MTSKNIKSQINLLQKKFNLKVNLSVSNFPKNNLQAELFPLIIIPHNTIPIEKQLQEAKVSPLLPLEKYKKLSKQKKPYLIYFKDGEKNRGKSASQVKTNLQKSERGMLLEEGIALAMQYPQIINIFAIDLVGSLYSIECIPTIFSWKNKNFLSAICPDVKDTGCTVLICLK